MEKLNKEKFLAAVKFIEKVANTQANVKFVKGFTEIPYGYRIGCEWETWAAFARVALRKNKELNLNSKEFWQNLAESNASFFWVKGNDLLDIVILENPKVSMRPARWKSWELHSLSGPSIEWEDGVKVYAGEGMLLPAKLYENPDEVTGQELASLDLEKRRLACLIMGAEKFFKALGSTPELIDSGVDNQGNMMELLKFYDKSLDREIKTLKVVCPSTQRIYYIYPPNQNVTNVWDAKASTFGNKPLAFRQGDVGLQFVDKENPQHPFVET